MCIMTPIRRNIFDDFHGVFFHIATLTLSPSIETPRNGVVGNYNGVNYLF